MKIINIDKSYLSKAAKCHIDSFPDSFSSKLGLRYCKKYLSWFLTSNERFLFGVKENNDIVCYLGASLGYGSTSKIIQFSFLHLLISIFTKPYLITNKKIFKNVALIKKNIFAKISKLFLKKNFIDSLEKIDSIGLVVIGVHPNYRKQEFGKSLMDEFDRRCVSMGYRIAHLSVKKENSAACKFYAKNGWEIVEETSTTFTLNKKIF